MRTIFLKALAFMLGFKHKSGEELAEEGRKIRLKMIQDQIKMNQKIDFRHLKEIYFIGAIQYSDSELQRIKNRVIDKGHYEFKIPDFSPDKDYINFYQIITKDDRYFILALCDNFRFYELEKSLFLIEIKNKISTAHLPSEAKYL